MSDQSLIAFAAVMTVIATFIAPLISLWISFAVSDRREHRARKYQTFLALMSERGKLFDREGTRLLNVVDVVFSDNKKVRNAWADFHHLVSQYAAENRSSHEVDQARFRVLREMADDLSIGHALSNADFYRTYEPTILFKQRQIELFKTDLAHDEMMRFYQGQSNAATADEHKPVAPVD